MRSCAAGGNFTAKMRQTHMLAACGWILSLVPVRAGTTSPFRCKHFRDEAAKNGAPNTCWLLVIGYFCLCRCVPALPHPFGASTFAMKPAKEWAPNTTLLWLLVFFQICLQIALVCRLGVETTVELCCVAWVRLGSGQRDVLSGSLRPESKWVEEICGRGDIQRVSDVIDQSVGAVPVDRECLCLGFALQALAV